MADSDDEGWEGAGDAPSPAKKKISIRIRDAPGAAAGGGAAPIPKLAFSLAPPPPPSSGSASLVGLGTPPGPRPAQLPAGGRPPGPRPQPSPAAVYGGGPAAAASPAAGFTRPDFSQALPRPAAPDAGTDPFAGLIPDFLGQVPKVRPSRPAPPAPTLFLPAEGPAATASSASTALDPFESLSLGGSGTAAVSAAGGSATGGSDAAFDSMADFASGASFRASSGGSHAEGGATVSAQIEESDWDALHRMSGHKYPEDVPSQTNGDDALRSVPSRSSVASAGGGRPPLPQVLKVRLPPLRPKLAADLQLIAGIGHGCLLGAPTLAGGARLWGDADGAFAMQRPSAGEDGDGAAFADVGAIPNASVTCCHVQNTSQSAAGTLWTGHSNGQVANWSLNPFARLSQFQAHRGGAVTAITATAYGDIWTGSSRGSVRRFAGGVLVTPRNNGESSELRRGNGQKPHGHVRYLVSAPSTAAGPAGVCEVVWSAGHHNIAVWCSRTGMHLASIENGETTHGPGLAVVQARWDGRKVVSEELQGYLDGVVSPGGFDTGEMGRGRRATLAASRVAGNMAKKLAKGMHAAFADGPSSAEGSKQGMQYEPGPGSTEGFGDDGLDDPPAGEKGNPHGRLLTLCLGVGGTVWLGYQTGVIERHMSHGGHAAGKAQLKAGASVRALLLVGQHVWAGLGDGTIAAFDGDGQEVGQWRAHESAVKCLTQVGARVFSLSTDGAVNGWGAAQPWEARGRAKLNKAITQQAAEFIAPKRLHVLAGTWNVNEMDPKEISSSSISQWLQHATGCQVVVVGLQEIEVGGRAVVESLVKDTFAKGMQEKGNFTAQAWVTAIEAVLGTVTGRKWERSGVRQLAGMLVAVYSDAALAPHVGEVHTASVATGVMGVGGNKGAVAVSLSIFRRRFLFANSHFAAHQGAVAKRNEDYAQILSQLAFAHTREEGRPAGEARSRAATGDDAFAAGAAGTMAAGPESVAAQKAECFVWVGDFNYRVDNLTRDEAVRHIEQGRLDVLLQNDQCKNAMGAGQTFVGFKEGPVCFKPTFKFDKRTSTYDTSEKQRIPAWCDRVMFKGTLPSTPGQPDHLGNDLEIDVDAAAHTSRSRGTRTLVVDCKNYDSCHNIVDSDHKPVVAQLEVNMACVDWKAMRARVCALLLQAQAPAPVSMSVTPCVLSVAARASLAPAKTCKEFALANHGPDPVHFEVRRIEARSGKAIGLPGWCTVEPAFGTVPPRATERVRFAVHTNVSVGMDSITNAVRLEVACVGGLRRNGARPAEYSQRLVVDVNLS